MFTKNFFFVFGLIVFILAHLLPFGFLDFTNMLVLPFNFRIYLYIFQCALLVYLLFSKYWWR